MDGQGRSGHVVVCGVRGVGLRTVEQLHATGVVVTVVAEDVHPITQRLLDRWDVSWFTGRSLEALTDAGLATAAAVVCVLDDDLRALEVALAVRRLRPDVRLVVRMGNPAVSRALAQLLGPGSVLDVADLAAPSVVEACLGQRTHPLRLAGQDFVVTELVAPRDATLRELFGELAPIAVQHARADPAICPGRDHPVRAGDRVAVLGTRTQFNAAGVSAEQLDADRPRGVGARMGAAMRAAERAEAGGRPGLVTLLRTLTTELDGQLRGTLLLLAGLAVVAVTVLRLGYRKPGGAPMTVLDAVYFTVETIGTVGYGDFSFADQAPWLRTFAIGLMLLGVVLAALLFAQLTQLLVSRRIERSFDRRRVETMRGHVVLVGLGAVGLGVLEGLLAADRRVVVIERDEANRHLPHARRLGVPIVHGDATDLDVLAAVNLGAAAAIAALTSDDLVNIETGLAVRDQLGARFADVPVVLRVFDRRLGDEVGDGFGFRFVRSTAALAAPWFVGAALGLDVLGTFYVDRLPFMVGRLDVAPGGGLDGLAMGELSARTRVVAIDRAERRPGGRGEECLEYPPRSGTRFGPGDVAYLVGPYEELLAVLRRDALAPHPLSRG